MAINEQELARWEVDADDFSESTATIEDVTVMFARRTKVLIAEVKRLRVQQARLAIAVQAPNRMIPDADD